MSSAPPEKLAPTILRLILSRLEAGTLSLAAMPNEAAAIVTALNAEASLHKVAGHVERSPVLAVEVMRQANSAAYGSRKVETISAAVTTLGESNLMSLTVELAVRELFSDIDPRVAKGCKAIWDHSLAVALVARDLCKQVKAGDSGLTYMAGLLHDIGKPTVGGFLASAGSSMPELPEGWWDWWLDVIVSIHREVGVAVVKSWNLPDVAVSVIENIEDYDASKAVSEGNVIRFANALVKTKGFSVGEFDADQVDVLVMVGKSLMNISDDLIDEVTEDLASRVSAAQ